MADRTRHIGLARENEDFAVSILSDYDNKYDWAITVRFYSFVHYVEERLNSYDYTSSTHSERKQNIRNCRLIDNSARKVYRQLEDISRDARYECIKMSSDDAKVSKEMLEKGKKVLNFDGGNDTSHKYST